MAQLTSIAIDTVPFSGWILFVLLLLHVECGTTLYCRPMNWMLPFLPLVLSRKLFHDFPPVAMAMTLCIFAFQGSALFNMRLRAQQARWRSHVRDQRAEENTWRQPKFFIICVFMILSYSTTWLVVLCLQNYEYSCVIPTLWCSVSMLNYVYELCL